MNEQSTVTSDFKNAENLSGPNEKVWVNWRFEMQNGRETKVPYATNGRKAESNDPATWSTFTEVVTASDKFDGIGIVFNGKLLGIDLDHVMVDGKVSTKISEIVEKAQTYTEISPSGTGLHLYLPLTEPLILEANRSPRGQGGDYECYTSGRYFTVTGTEWEVSYPLRTVTQNEVLDILHLLGYPWKKQEKSNGETNAPARKKLLGDEDILKKMFLAVNGLAIKALYDGDTSVYGGDDSVADAALCSHLAFWTGRNAPQMERIWLASPLGQREKTENRQDYRKRTIDFAISNCQQIYMGKMMEEVISIEKIDEKLKQIPVDTQKMKLMEVLEPIFQKLVGIDKITAETFILNNIKEHFGIPREAAKKYVPYVNGLREKFKRDIKETKEKEERLPLILDRDIDFQEVHDAVSEIGIVNKETLKIVIATVISAQLRLNPPLWLFLIGVPSSFKTELVSLFSAMYEIYTLDTLTENAFASGYVPPDGSETQDLLPLLDNKCFIIKDLNTLFSMNEEMVKKILGDLTSIFDGKFEKFTATRGMISYSALFSMIGCITPSILIKHYNYATQLGPRFFFLRLPELTEKDLQTGFKKFWSETSRKEKIIKARQLVSSYATQLIKKIKQHKADPESDEIQNKINNVARFICKARGLAITVKATFDDEKGRRVEYDEIKDWQVEDPWRILNQLKSLLRILSFINGKNTVDEEEIGLIRGIILSTMPVDRSEVLVILTKKCGLSVKDLSKEIQKSSKTIRRTMKVLEALGIIDSFRDPKYSSSNKAPRLYFIREEFASILDAPMPSPESVSLSKSLNEGAESDSDEDLEDDTDDIVNIPSTPIKTDSPEDLPF